MKFSDFYSITIIRNNSIPLSFIIAKKHLFALIITILLILIILTYLLFSFFILTNENKLLKKSLKTTNNKLKKITEYISQKDYENFFSEKHLTNNINQLKKDLIEQPEFVIKGLWTPQKSNLSEEDLVEGDAVTIINFKNYLKNDKFHIQISLKNSSNPFRVIGGYICITLVNQNQTPVVYKTMGSGALGENGYPTNYKAGFQYYLKNRPRTFYKKIKLTRDDEFYTEALIFIFTYKGHMISKQSFKINKDMFLD